MLLLFIQNNDCNGFASWIPWLFGAFLLGTIFGWLLSKILGGSDNSLQAKCDALQTELNACRSNSKKALAGASSFAAAPKKAKVKAAIAVADDSVKDDLTKIEGIGPKIQGLLNNEGIWSSKQLSEVPEKRVQKILDAAGPAYTIHKPKTWAEQAIMAHKGEWKKLEKWQDELKGGL